MMDRHAALATIGRIGVMTLDNRPRGLKLQRLDRLNKLTRIAHGSVLAPDGNWKAKYIAGRPQAQIAQTCASS
jgi:hypothetical protein